MQRVKLWECTCQLAVGYVTGQVTNWTGNSCYSVNLPWAMQSDTALFSDAVEFCQTYGVTVIFPKSAHWVMLTEYYVNLRFTYFTYYSMLCFYEMFSYILLLCCLCCTLIVLGNYVVLCCVSCYWGCWYDVAYSDTYLSVFDISIG